jgi:putative ABC transport system permease protein
MDTTPGGIAPLLRIIAVVSRIVPAEDRPRWRDEWQAELWHRASWLASRGPLPRRARLALLASCAGALVHALWLRADQWSFEMVRQDLRFAWRTLGRQRTFTLMAVLTLGLGVGLTTAMFTIVNAVLLNPLPYREPDRLVELWETNPLRNWTHATAAPANLLDWRARNRVFEDLAWYRGSTSGQPSDLSVNLTSGDTTEHVRAMLVSANFFNVLGARAALGRTFAAGQDVIGAKRVVVLSHAFWHQRFGGDPALLGRTVRLHAMPVEVVGVMPPAFRFGAWQPDCWLLLLANPADWAQVRRPHYLGVIGRLKPGVQLPEARSDMHRIAAQLEREYPDTNTQMGVGVGMLKEWYVGDVRRPLVLFFVAVALVLLIACANVAGLLLARAADRARELAVRAALGAGRVRLVRQLLTESLVLAAAGGLLGLAIAGWLVQLFVRFSPSDIPRLDEVRIDLRVVAFMLLTTSATTILFGLMPSLQAARRTVADSLRQGSRGTTGGAQSQRTRRVLVVAEVALAVVLLAGAGLLLRSVGRLMNVDPGVRPARVLLARVSLPGRVYDTDETTIAFFDRALQGIRELPDVEAAGATTVPPLGGFRWTGDLSIEGQPSVWGRELRHKEVTPGYFGAVGLPILRGRDFSARDTARMPPVAIVNRTLARHFFGDADPIGRRISYTKPGQQPTWRTVIGVVGDEKQDSLSRPVQPEAYDSCLQSPQDEMTLAIRSRGTPDAVVPAVREVIRRMDRGIALFDIETMEQRVAESITRERFTALLVTAFAGVAIVLAAVGVYGVLAMVVGRRRQEISVRVALGATARDVRRLVMSEGVGLVALGLAIGAALALAATRLMEALLFEVSPHDPMTFGGVAAVLIVIGMAACYVPVRRALRIAPIEALRAE